MTYKVINKQNNIVIIFIMAVFINTAKAESNPTTRKCTKIISNEKLANLIPTYKNINNALEKYVDGDVICLADGEQPAITIENFDSGSKPLIIRPWHYLRTKIKNRHYTGTGITIKNSQGIIIKGLIITGGLTAILVQDSSNISILSNKVFNTGNQAISIKPRHHGGSHYLVKDNVIFNTGLLNPRYGEGLYIGDGSYTEDKSRLKIQYTVDDVIIKNNIIHHTRNEAIDVKANAYNVKIISNSINDINLKFNAAITIATESSFAELGGYEIIDNVITNVVNRSGYRPIGIAVGHGDTLIKNNLIIDNNDNDNFLATCLFTTFLNPKLNKVTLENNQLIGTGTPFSAGCRGGTNDNAKAVVLFK
ncbi:MULTISPECIES: right-handed parallel beta-helix repeat-containing protein [unclassified Moritella]|uniref:right-handed parallel beta-helix repeat-containing protein n=1 Tax=unclassified Moritella TaxID=2637987 RepID=UPI001BAE50F5|nr:MULTISPECIES: right-handed parallel beta-helix repeat-containing protein [unclassified Moritella]QUM84995.1 right-handed parallel beta-helix repeat-containing protein [Moritella sp. 28]QUM89227.1 right-handed parallel beta-helix repeat-containing protein [Moritella sp. 36]